MTDRFYPRGKPSAEDAWKTSYEVQNEMRAFQRSAYPPGYAGHEPGARDKFGFSTPGPDAHKLTQSGLCLREDIDIDQPRRIHAMPRHQVIDDHHTFQNLDMPEMDRSYKSGILSPSFRSMAKSRSLPIVQKKAAPPKLSPVPPAMQRLDDDHFSYFVPKALNREGVDRLMSRSLPKLYKHPVKKVMLPFAGDGTGFRTSCSGVEWWPSASRLHDEPSSYVSAFQRPSFYRMSPTLNSSSEVSSSRSIQFGRGEPADGNGSIRLGTPRLDEKQEMHPRFKSGPGLDSVSMYEKTSNAPKITPTPAARFGYMPPGAGLIDRSCGSKAVPVANQDLSDSIMAKVVKLYQAMDDNHNGSITRSEANHFFRAYGEISANAMFDEVDADGNGEISFEEFVEFWMQVKRSGYTDDDLSLELDELLSGNVWVDFKDERDVGLSYGATYHG